MMRRVVLILAAMGLLMGGAWAANVSAADAQRVVLRLKSVPAADIAAAISRLWESPPEAKDEPVESRSPGATVSAEPISNSLLISGSEADVQQVIALVDQLDRAPHVISISILIAELTSALHGSPQRRSGSEGESGGADSPGEERAPGDANPAAAQAPIELTDDLARQMQSLAKRGEIQFLSRVELTTLDNLPATFQVGERTPVVTGVARDFRSQATRSISFENTGMLIRVTPRASGRQSVTLEVQIERSSLAAETVGPVIGADAEGREIRAPRVQTLTSQTTVSAQDGQTVIVGGMKSQHGSDRRELWILVTPRIQ